MYMGVKIPFFKFLQMSRSPRTSGLPAEFFGMKVKVVLAWRSKEQKKVGLAYKLFSTCKVKSMCFLFQTRLHQKQRFVARSFCPMTWRRLVESLSSAHRTQYLYTSRLDSRMACCSIQVCFIWGSIGIKKQRSIGRHYFYIISLYSGSFTLLKIVVTRYYNVWLIIEEVFWH